MEKNEEEKVAEQEVTKESHGKDREEEEDEDHEDKSIEVGPQYTLKEQLEKDKKLNRRMMKA
ncbi:hypothetical protein LINPERPRIM_LOCUS10302 [Linum perenne]